MRLLLVEDEQRMAAAMQRGLVHAGFTVDVAHDGVRGFAMACETSYDAIVLDVMLPGLSGYEVTKRLRAKGVWTPILLASAKDGEYDQADGLDLGADDYLTKPFSFVVLLARLRALLRRSAEPRPVTLVVGALELDPAARTVSVEGAAVDLTAREYGDAGVPHAAPRHGRDQGRPAGPCLGRLRDRPQRRRGLRRLPAAQDRPGTARDGTRRGVPSARTPHDPLGLAGPAVVAGPGSRWSRPRSLR